MKLRQHLRAWAAISLVVQSAWVFALVPADCCAEHTPMAAASCHEEGAHATDSDCVMRGRCGGPMGALMSLLSAQAVLTPPAHTRLDASVSTSIAETREQLISRVIPPDSPPPRV